MCALRLPGAIGGPVRQANGRRRFHGGKSTGPPKGSRNAFKHGIYSTGYTEDERADLERFHSVAGLDQEIVLARVQLSRAWVYVLIAIDNSEGETLEFVETKVDEHTGQVLGKDGEVIDVSRRREEVVRKRPDLWRVIDRCLARVSRLLKDDPQEAAMAIRQAIREMEDATGITPDDELSLGPGPEAELKNLERLFLHPAGQAYSRSPHRFNTVYAGRRSGKTLRLKRKVWIASQRGSAFPDPHYFLGAPTRDQAKRIFWNDMKLMVPRRLRRGAPSESELVIPCLSGSNIHIIGLDKPQRIEGSPWDGGGITEFANVRGDAWPLHIRPALSDRGGWCDLEGVPEGRNHFYDRVLDAEAKMERYRKLSEWGSFHWKSSEVLPPSEIEAARRDLDALSFQQEYDADFVSFQGKA
jgi:hypothetical protein